MKIFVVRRIVTTLLPLHITDIDVQCYEYEGIDAIKEALHAGIQQGTEVSRIKVGSCHPCALVLLEYVALLPFFLDVQINLVAAPTYVVTTVSLDKDQGTELVNAAINAITLKISSLGGSLEVKHAVCDPLPPCSCTHGLHQCCLRRGRSTPVKRARRGRTKPRTCQLRTAKARTMRTPMTPTSERYIVDNFSWLKISYAMHEVDGVLTATE